MATLIHTTGQQLEVKPDNGTGFSLKEVQAMIGGYVELVPSTLAMQNRRMLVDEDGLLKELPYNAIASRIAGRKIVGSVLLVTHAEFE